MRLERFDFFEQVPWRPLTDHEQCVLRWHKADYVTALKSSGLLERAREFRFCIASGHVAESNSVRKTIAALVVIGLVWLGYISLAAV